MASVQKPLAHALTLVRAFLHISLPAAHAAVDFPRPAGSNVIVAGTAIFGAENPESVIQDLKDVVNTAQARSH